VTPPLVEITAVLQSRPSDRVLGSQIERPVSGSAFDRTTFDVSGWVVGRHSPAREIQLLARGRVLRTIPLSAARPEVVAQHPEAPERNGFWTLTGTLGLDRTFAVDVQAVLEDGSHVKFGSIRGRRRPVTTSFEPKLTPLMLTSLGRTGTTLAMSLLSAHPSIVAHRTYPYEIFPAKYWLHMLRVLAEPADHIASVQPEGFTDDLWRIGQNPFHTAPITNDPELMQLLGTTYVERLARFCQASIDDLYLALASSQGQPSASFFAEKFQPGHIPSLAWDLYPKAKEVFLVRDFRDVICSVFAFNEKRGNVGFGRDRCETDEDYVRYVAGGAKQLLRDWQQRRDESHLVRYEDLATQPHETTGTMLEYLGLPGPPETVDLMVRTAFESPSLDKHRSSASVQESISRWGRELPPALRSVCREVLDPVLTELGYEPTDDAAAGAVRVRARAERPEAPTESAVRAEDALERFDPEVMHGQLIEAEHLARYWWAAALVPGKRVLDAGCGTAYGTEILAQAGAAEVLGVDLDADVVEAARPSAPENVMLEVGDVRKLPFEDGSFELAVCFEVIEHVEEPERVLDELRRVLGPDGLLLVSSPNRDVYPPGNPHHKHEFLPDELADALSARFGQVRLVRQQDWLGSGVLDDLVFALDGEGAFEAVVRKAVRGAPGEELYTLALASDAELPETAPYVVLTETAEAKWWQLQIDRARDERDAIEQTLGEVVDELAERDSELRASHEVIHSMQATRVWRIGTSYWNLRNRLLRRS
jgi:SAM-dependent methyltransferase